MNIIRVYRGMYFVRKGLPLERGETTGMNGERGLRVCYKIVAVNRCA